MAILLLGIGSSSLHAQRSEPWWQQETRMSKEGRLTLNAKPWWPRAEKLREGERFTLDLNGDGRPDAIVARMDSDIVEAIDDTGHAADLWNKQDTTYVVSYGGSGKVDRMVSYIGNHRGGAQEVELRYFRDGYLRYAWFAESEDADAATIFALKHWQYAGNDQGSQFRGNAQIYINKYDARAGAWQPLSECPFTFWDLDHDGRTDVTLRVSAAPIKSLHSPDTDYANNYDYMWAPESIPLKDMGALNMRLSFNLDSHPRTEPLSKPHSTFSFTMVGAQPYRYAAMQDLNLRRRAPQTTIHMPWRNRWVAAMNYPATSVGFSWDEARQIFRWEGEFWIYERRYLSNTGSPTQRWNMRREFSAEKSAQRKLYYSAADRRYHLQGASEGWLEVAVLKTDEKVLEYRWWDSDHDGRLDTVEVYRAGNPIPARTAHFDPHPRTVLLEQQGLAREYTGKVLPAAIVQDQNVIAQLKSLVSEDMATRFEDDARNADSLEQRRFCLDVARELLFLKLLDRIHSEEQKLPYPSSHIDAKRFRDPSPGSAVGGYTLGDSLRYWSLVRAEHELNACYADGDFEKFTGQLRELKWN